MGSLLSSRVATLLEYSLTSGGEMVFFKEASRSHGRGICVARSQAAKRLGNMGRNIALKSEEDLHCIVVLR